MSNLMCREHLQAENKYKDLRKIAYEVAMDEFSEIEISGISYLDALEADRWKKIQNEGNRLQRASWSWAKEYPFYQKRPNRFEVSVKKDGILGGICFGQLSRNGTNMRMNIIESTPIRPTPLGMRALPIISYTAAIFAKVVGADEVWVIDPLPSLENVYQSEGFGPREYYHGTRVGQRRVL